MTTSLWDTLASRFVKSGRRAVEEALTPRRSSGRRVFVKSPASSSGKAPEDDDDCSLLKVTTEKEAWCLGGLGEFDVARVMEMLGVGSVARLARVSKPWRDASRAEGLWRFFCCEEGYYEKDLSWRSTFQEIHSLPKLQHLAEGLTCQRSAELALVGDAGSGKTAFLTRFSDETFVDCDTPKERTGAITTTIEKVRVQRKETYRVRVRDDENCDVKDSNRLEAFLKGVDGCFLTIDLANKHSFQHADQWLHAIQEVSGQKRKVLVVGCKSDRHDRQVSFIDAKRWAHHHHLQYVETTAKLNKGLDRALATLLWRLFKDVHQYEPAPKKRPDTSTYPHRRSIMATSLRHHSTLTMAAMAPCIRRMS